MSIFHKNRKFSFAGKIVITAVFLISIIITQSGCKAKQEPVSVDGFYLDTFCNISIYEAEGLGQEDMENLAKKAFDLVKSLENTLSRTVEDSEISRINDAGGKAVKVSENTLEIIKKAMHYREVSEGKFDITIGGAADLWDWHNTDEEFNFKGQMPDAEDIKEKMKHVGTDVIITDDTVTLTDADARIDLGGAAKGYIADEVTAFLKDNGVTRAIINLGGNISTICADDGENFEIGIADPSSNDGGIIGTVECKNVSMVTSGTYQRYFIYEGKKYHHILDAETGWPAETDVQSATIIGDSSSGADCDCLSTICVLLGKEKALQLIEQMDGYEAVIIDTDGEIHCTDDNLLKK